MKKPATPLEDLLANDAWIRSLARHLVSDEHAAEDLVQDTWLVALEREQERPNRVRAWLGGVLRNLAGKRNRDLARRNEHERQGARPDRLPSVAEVMDQETTRLRLVKATFSLEEPYRSAIIYRYFKNLPPRAIAEQLDMTVEAVKKRITRGLEQLRARLNSEFGGSGTWHRALLPLTVPTAAEAVAATATSSLTGALVMGMKVKIGIAAAVLLGTAFILWTRGSETTLPRSEEAPEASSTMGKAVPVDAAASRAAKTGQVGRAPRAPSASEAPASAAAPVPRPGFITGTVRRTSGEPISGAKLRAFGYPGRGQTAEKVLVRAKTDSSGAYVLGPLPRRGYLGIIEASAEGHYAERREALAGTVQDFVLGRGGKLSGHIRVAGSMAPCAGAVVMAFWTRAETAFETGFWNIRSLGLPTVADAGGAYRFTNLRPGTYRLSIFPGENPAWDPAPALIEVRGVGETVKDFAMSSGYPLCGRVIDRVTGKPIEGAVILLADNPWQHTRTDRDGRFEMRGMPHRGSGSIFVRAEGYRDAHEQVHNATKGTLVKNFALAPQPSASLEGSVIDPNGRGIAGARVSAGGREAAMTGEDGRFRVTGVRSARGSARIQVEAEGFAKWVVRVEDVRVGGETGELLIRLEKRGGTVWGRVADDAGQPVQEAKVFLKKPGSRTYSTSTDEKGHFEIQNMVAGTYRIDAVTKGALETECSRFQRVTQAGVRVEEGGRTHVALTLRPGSFLAGRVVDGFGRPMDDVSVYARPDWKWVKKDGLRSHGARRGRTGVDGSFRLEGLPEGEVTYIVSARKQGYHAAELPDPRPGQGFHQHEMRTVVLYDVKVGTTDLCLRLAKKPWIEGRVTVAATGQPATEFWIRAVGLRPEKPRRGKTFQGYFVDPEGRFVLPVREGSFAVTAKTPTGENSLPLTVQVKRDDPAPSIQLIVHPGTTVQGTVHAPGGARAPGCKVVLLVAEGRERGRRLGVAMTDDSGCFVIQHIPPGAYLARATQEGHPDQEGLERIDVAAGGETRVSLSLAICGRFQAWVKDRGGRAIQGAIVTVRREDGAIVKLDRWRYYAELRRRFRTEGVEVNFTFWPPFTRTDKAGVTRHRYLAAGRYLAEVSAPGFQAKKQAFTMASSMDTRLEVTVEK